MNWQKRAEQLKPNNSWTETAKAIQSEYFPNDALQSVYDRVRSYLRRVANGQTTIRQTKPLVEMLKCGASAEDIAKSNHVTVRIAKAMIDDLVDQGYQIDCEDDTYQLRHYALENENRSSLDWNGDKIIRFGVVSDTHFGSNYTQITHLHTAYDVFKAEGITDIYHAGDLTEGENMRPGHAYECYIHGMDKHIDELVRNYPKRDGLKTHFITGNHDASFIKHVGADIGKRLGQERPDMDYLGYSSAIVGVTPNCTMELRHPGGGSSYSISYKSQKMIDSLSGGEKPNILIIGHFHKAEYISYRNVHCLQAGTLQAQSGFMKEHGLFANVGYWIVTVHVDEDGQINRFVPEWLQFYKSIKDDYSNWR